MIALVLGVVIVARLTSGSDLPHTVCGEPHWTTSWMAAPGDSSGRDPATPPPGDGSAGHRVFADQTFRMIVAPHLAGTQARIELSNRFGSRTVVLDGIRIGVHGDGAAVVLGSERPVTFGGENSTSIRAGRTAESDPLPFTVAPFQELAVTFHLTNRSPLDVHVAAMATQYMTPIGSGDFTGDTTGVAFTDRLGSWVALNAIDVVAPDTTGAVAVLGDSLTDGIGSTFDANARFPDALQFRVLTDPSHPMSVLNAGISGNQIAYDRSALVAAESRSAGPSGVHRLHADALNHDGVNAVIVYLGINDLFSAVTATPARDIIDSYESIIEEAHAANVRVIGATLTPANLNGDSESDRQTVNDWIRHSGKFDGVLDFDKVVRSRVAPNQLSSLYTDEIVHLNDKGYAALATSVDLATISGTPCTAR